MLLYVICNRRGALLDTMRGPHLAKSHRVFDQKFVKHAKLKNWAATYPYCTRSYGLNSLPGQFQVLLSADLPMGDSHGDLKKRYFYGLQNAFTPAPKEP